MNNSKLIFVVFLLFAFSACGGGGGGADGGVPGTNACSDLRLPVKVVNGTACGQIRSAPVVRVILKIVDGLGERSVFGCTGTLISKRSVLTAAHCFVNDAAKPYTVVGGAIGIGELSSLQVVEAEAIHTHPDYQNNAAGLVRYDAAVMRLTREVNSLSLPLLVSRTASEGDIADVYGYGQTVVGADVVGDTSDFSDLVSGQMKIDEVKDLHVFVKYTGEGSNVCFGDSGGPLVLTFNGIAGLVGVVSASSRRDCGPGDITAFTNITDGSILSWILDVAPEAVML